jgi:hypothetical protein
VRYLWELADTRAACVPPASEASALDELCTVLVRVHSAHGGEDGRCRGLADPGQVPQALGVGSGCQECAGLVEPAWLFGHGIAPGAGPGWALDLVEAVGGLEPEAGVGSVLEAVAGLRAPPPAARAGVPLGYAVGAAVVQDSFWGGLGGHEAPSGRWWQGFPQRMACRTCEVESRAPVRTPLAAPLLQSHRLSQPAVGGLERRGTFDGQAALALAPSGMVWRWGRTAWQGPRQTVSPQLWSRS